LQIFYYLDLINNIFLFGVMEWTALAVFNIFYYDFVLVICNFGV